MRGVTEVDPPTLAFPTRGLKGLQGVLRVVGRLGHPLLLDPSHPLLHYKCPYPSRTKYFLFTGFTQDQGAVMVQEVGEEVKMRSILMDLSEMRKIISFLTYFSLKNSIIFNYFKHADSNI